LTLSDRIAVMNRGRVEQVGDPTELYDTPATGFVARFIGESNRLEGTVHAGEGGRPVLVTRAGLRLPVRPGGAVIGEAAVLLLRPERIAIATDAGAGPDPVTTGPTVVGDIVETVFVGDATRYVVRAAGGETFTVKRLNLDAADRLKVGARVTLRWDPDTAFTQRRDP
jgi:ABC-type Fe3+/spermidine/putrescine transport system ATPase subunit